MKGYLPVHCCCEPGRRFGWVPVPERQRVRGAIYFVIAPGRMEWREGNSVHLVFAQTINTEVNDLALAPVDGGPGEIILAVNSADQPIETWRKVPGFIEEHRR